VVQLKIPPSRNPEIPDICIAQYIPSYLVVELRILFPGHPHIMIADPESPPAKSGKINVYLQSKSTYVSS